MAMAYSCVLQVSIVKRLFVKGLKLMSTLQREVFQMVYALPENSLSSINPLLSELLTNAVLMTDSTANVAEMDDLDKYLFLKTVKRINDDDYVSFEDALIECGVELNEV